MSPDLPLSVEYAIRKVRETCLGVSLGHVVSGSRTIGPFFYLCRLPHGRYNPRCTRWVMRFGEKPYMRLNNPKRSIALGLIRAQVGAYDQRTKVLTLTPKGVRVKQQIDGNEVQHEAS